jgi:hypothetical protein
MPCSEQTALSVLDHSMVLPLDSLIRWAYQHNRIMVNLLSIGAALMRWSASWDYHSEVTTCCCATSHLPHLLPYVTQALGDHGAD